MARPKSAATATAQAAAASAALAPNSRASSPVVNEVRRPAGCPALKGT